MYLYKKKKKYHGLHFNLKPRQPGIKGSMLLWERDLLFFLHETYNVMPFVLKASNNLTDTHVIRLCVNGKMTFFFPLSLRICQFGTGVWKGGFFAWFLGVVLNGHLSHIKVFGYLAAFLLWCFKPICFRRWQLYLNTMWLISSFCGLF